MLPWIARPRRSARPVVSPHRQRGAIGLMAALTLAIAIVFLGLAIDSGRLYLERRQLQRVADMAALEAVSLGGSCVAPSLTAAGFASASATRNNFTVPSGTRTLVTTCGTVATDANAQRQYSVNAASTDAVRVVVSEAVTTSLVSAVGAFFGGAAPGTKSTLSATAVAANQGSPLAQLTLRSTLLSVDATSAPALNLLLGGLLGGSVNLSVASYNGLLNSNINLLNYLNQLAINLGVTAGNYTALLNTNVSATQLLQAAATVLQQSGSTASITSAVQGLTSLAAVAPAGTLVNLGSVLQIQSGTAASALNVNLQAYSLAQDVVQLANSSNAVSASLPTTVLGQTVTTQLKVLQPAQLSAIGNPALAQAAPLGANKIYVRTAQTRALVTLSLPALGTLTNASSQILNLVAPVDTLLNSLLSLNLVGTVTALNCLVGATCTQTSIQLVPSPSLEISLDVASSASYVTGYTCPTKSLTTLTSTAAVDMSVGNINAASAFSSSALPSVTPLAVIDIGTQSCKTFLSLPISCSPRVPYAGGGMGFMINDLQVAPATQSMLFSGGTVPAEINQPPTYQSFSTSSIVSTLNSALSSISLTEYAPGSGSTLGSALSLVASAFTTVQGIVQGAVQPFLSAALTPLISSLASQLGINLAQAEVGANLSCNFGGRPGLVQ